ncbi:hypothetical protein C8F04DRAFT_325120 [Mycena alexandri]|uniref:Protein kinase domain-containing protein n=1 Tax=Mycena alexandri TaxID=1745969 RepID=A0AAD6S259_9AGAR|nr:hypothetical protein C8F04DRAFT_325120 [Mycena alexandri]
MQTDGHVSSGDECIVPVPGTKEPTTSCGGGIFSCSHHVIIHGGTFNNITKNEVAPSAVSPVRMIPISDIDLRHELLVHKHSGLIGRRPERQCVRRVYSAKVDGRNTAMTVAVYQGDGAEEAWRRDVELYMSVRHPNIIQIWGGASWGEINTTMFHGDLVPVKQFVAPYSSIMTAYLYACYHKEWVQVADYFRSTLNQEIGSPECTMWIRSSTGRLCADLVSADPANAIYLYENDIAHRQATFSWTTQSQEASAIDSLTLERYHRICCCTLFHYRATSISTSATVTLGAVISWPSDESKDHIEIIASRIDVDYGGWWLGETRLAEVTENGWTRCKVEDLFDDKIMFILFNDDNSIWLSQASHIFSRCQITSNLEDYALVDKITFKILFSNTGEHPAPGYLFLCPQRDFGVGSLAFRWPDCPAYWSLDPSGVERLSTTEAMSLGFPSIQLSTRLYGISWTTEVYAGLRQFHRAKGFNPDSQDVARHLGKPLFQLYRDMQPFAHVDEWSETEEDGDVHQPNIFMHLQLTLILLLAIFWVYEKVWLEAPGYT